MNKILAAAALCLLLLSTIPAASSQTELIFAAVNTQLLPRETSYLPYQSGGTWHVPVPLLTYSTGLSSAYSKEQQIMVIYSTAGRELCFDLRSNVAFDRNTQYTVRALQSGSLFYVPADFVTSYFGFSYSVPTSAYGPVFRLKTRTDVNDVSFVAAVVPLLKREYDAIYPPPAPSQTPIIPASSQPPTVFPSPKPSQSATPAQSQSPAPSQSPATPTPDPVLREVYLTFDGSPDGEITEAILDTLKEYNTKATFFVLGENIKKDREENAELLRRMLCDGHAVGLQGYSEEDFYRSEEGMLADLERVNELLYEEVFMRSRIVRTPGGSGPKDSPKLTPALQKALNGAGYRFWDWTVEPEATGRLQGRQLADRTMSMLEKLENKPAVIRLQTHEATLEALPQLLQYLRQERYNFHVITEHELPINMLDNVH